MTYRTLEQTYRRLGEAHVEKDANDQIAVGSYQTKAFEQSPEAQKLYMNFPQKHATTGEQIAVQLDRLFDLHKTVVSQERASPADLDHARQLVDTVLTLAGGIDMADEHSFVSKTVKDIEKYLKPHSNFVDDHIHPADNPRFASPPKHNLPDAKQNVQGKGDRDMDNTRHYAIARGLKAQRKIKLIDTD